MHAILPQDLSSRLVSINVADNTYVDASGVEQTPGFYDATTKYAAGAVVVVEAEHKVYRAIDIPGTGFIGKYPPDNLVDPSSTTDDTTGWYELSATNKWSFADSVLSTATQAPGHLAMTLDVSRCTAIMLANIVGGLVTFTHRIGSVAPADDKGDVVTTQSTSLIYRDCTNFTEFACSHLSYRTKSMMRFPGWPIGSFLDIRIDAGAGNAALGMAVLGIPVFVGHTNRDFKAPYISFSSIKTDSIGRTTFVQGAKADSFDCSVTVDPKMTDIVRNRYLSFDAALVGIWLENDEESTHDAAMACGYFSDLTPTIYSFDGGLNTFDVTFRGVA